jgi:hypothetical protein
MSSEQSPPVTVITVPPATTTTTEPTTTTTTVAPTTTVPPEPATTVTTLVVETPPVVGGDDVPEDGLVLLVFLGVASLVALVVGLVWAFRRRRRADVGSRLEVPPAAQAALADRIREVADRSRTAQPGPDSPVLDDISIADLYPWMDAGDDLTLVVDLTTAEALQKVGVTSLAQLAELDDERAEVLSEAGIQIDAASVIAAQDILGRRADDQH